MINIKEELISVIFPFYNVEKYIEQAIESILNQTYSNIEIIIINDGSKDKSEKKIEKYIKQYSNIKYINQENKGLAESRNVGIANATGEYIMFVDSDDFIHSSMIEKMYYDIKKNKASVSISGYYLYYEGDNKETKAVLPNIKENKIIGNDKILNYILEDRIKCFSCMKLIKKSIIEKVDFKFEKGRLYEDFLPTIKLLTKSQIVSIVNEPLYYYRQRPTSITQKKNIKVIDDYVYTINNVFNYIELSNLNINKKSKDKFIIDTLSNLIRKYIRNSNNNPRVMFNKDGNHKFEVSLFKIIYNRNISISNKILCLLWKLKFDWLLMKILL